MTLISGMALLTVLYIGVGRVDSGRLTGAELALVTLAVLAAFEAVHPLPVAFQYLGRTREAGRRLVEIVDTPPAVRFPASSTVHPAAFDLRFEQLRFGYAPHDPPALDHVTFRADGGRRTAVLGVTGSGKSTLVQLLVRFRDPDAGRIRIGGHDIRQLSEADLRRHVAVVSQQPHIFNASLRDNLLIADPGATEADLRRALADAQLLPFVDSLPDGLETRAGEGGGRLSGGQARRLAVARLFLRDARSGCWMSPPKDWTGSRNGG